MLMICASSVTCVSLGSIDFRFDSHGNLAFMRGVYTVVHIVG